VLRKNEHIKEDKDDSTKAHKHRSCKAETVADGGEMGGYQTETWL